MNIHPHLRLQNLNMVVDPLEHLSCSCGTLMITTFQMVLEEEVVLATVELIQSLPCWMAYLGYLTVDVSVLVCCCCRGPAAAQQSPSHRGPRTSVATPSE
jgi:hypothetical protein